MLDNLLTEDDVAPAGTLPDKLTIRYIKLSEDLLWQDNPKPDDNEEKIADLQASFYRHGFRISPVYSHALGAVVAGNQRIKALLDLKAQGKPAPQFISVEENGDWYIPVSFGQDFVDAAAAEDFAVDDNNLSAGKLTPVSVAMQIWDPVKYAKLLERKGPTPTTVGPDDIEQIKKLTAIMATAPKEAPVQPTEPDVKRIRFELLFDNTYDLATFKSMVEDAEPFDGNTNGSRLVRMLTGV